MYDKEDIQKMEWKRKSDCKGQQAIFRVFKAEKVVTTSAKDLCNFQGGAAPTSSRLLLDDLICGSPKHTVRSALSLRGLPEICLVISEPYG